MAEASVKCYCLEKEERKAEKKNGRDRKKKHEKGRNILSHFGAVTSAGMAVRPSSCPLPPFLFPYFNMAAAQLWSSRSFRAPNRIQDCFFSFFFRRIRFFFSLFLFPFAFDVLPSSQQTGVRPPASFICFM